MPEDLTVSVAPTTPESEPETSTVETSPVNPDAPAEPTDNTPENKPAEETRSDIRIRDTIAARKEAERLAAVKTQEAEYWKAQALANKPAEPEELDGVTDEGIDPVKFAKSLRAQILKEVQQNQGLSAAQQARLAEELEVSNEPRMKTDEFFNEYVVSYAKAHGVTPREAFQIAEERFSELEKKQNNNTKARDTAGKFVRDETSTPSTGRGTSSSTSNYTREQINNMSIPEYEKNKEEINRQMSQGLIK